MKHSSLISAFALALSPVLAHAGGELVPVRTAPPAPVPSPATPAAQPAPLAPAVLPHELIGDGPYAALYGGATFLEDADNVGDPFVAGEGDVSVESEFGTGWVVGGAVGYGLRNRGWRTRFEGDLAYRRNEVDELTIDNDGGLGLLLGLGSLDGFSTSDVDGDVETFSGTVNVWVDIPVSRAVTPFVGGGIGAANISLDDVSAEGIDLVDDSDTVFSWQLGAGLAWNFTPRLAATAEYRWFATDDPTFEAENGGDFDSEYSTHNAMIGLRVGF